MNARINCTEILICSGNLNPLSSFIYIKKISNKRDTERLNFFHNTFQAIFQLNFIDQGFKDFSINFSQFHVQHVLAIYNLHMMPRHFIPMKQNSLTDLVFFHHELRLSGIFRLSYKFFYLWGKNCETKSRQRSQSRQ